MHDKSTDRKKSHAMTGKCIMARMLQCMLFMIGSLATITALGCPWVSFPDAPEAVNQPPVIDAENTRPYIKGQSIAVGTIPRMTIVVADPDLADNLTVKVIKNLYETLDATEGKPHSLMLTDLVITPDDIVDPENAPTVRRKSDFQISATPCPTGSAGSLAILDVCISDRGFSLTGAPGENPCAPPRDGYVIRYYYVVNCVEP
jgi:hypothetical protein